MVRGDSRPHHDFFSTCRSTLRVVESVVGQVSVLRSGAHLSSHLRQHRTSGSNNLFPFAHDEQRSDS
jgi:hypothetical protein